MHIGDQGGRIAESRVPAVANVPEESRAPAEVNMASRFPAGVTPTPDSSLDITPGTNHIHDLYTVYFIKRHPLTSYADSIKLCLDRGQRCQPSIHSCNQYIFWPIDRNQTIIRYTLCI